MEEDAFSLYRPLRNYLRKQKLNESLLAIHSHVQFQQFRVSLPSYITGDPPGYRSIINFKDLLNFHLFPWELSLLCKEVLLNSEKYGFTHSLLEWHYLAGAVNKLKYLENGLAKLYSSKENVLLELFRISHRQFRWQRLPTMNTPARYWKIYSYKNLHALIEKCIGLTVEEIIKIGMSLLGVYQEKVALFYPPKSNYPELIKKNSISFWGIFCIDHEKLKILLAKEQQFNEKFAYTYSSLVAYPLIRKDWDERDAIICPIPRLLFERITDGIYYEICRAEGFDHSFGEAFQTYIGDAIKILYKKGKIYQESKYGKNNRTTDWIMEDNTAILFIECKTKRLTIGAKTELLNLDELESELDKIADAIVQTYKSIENYKNRLYPQIKFDPAKHLYPIIVTLEDWFLYGDPIIKKLDELVAIKLKSAGLNEDLMKSTPYCVMSAETFESFIFIANKNDIKSILEEKLFDQDKKYWEIENYLRHKFPEEIKHAGCPFISELNKRIETILNSKDFN